MLTPDSHCLLAEGAAALGIAINPQQIEQLHDFSQLIVKWNKTHNLTAITEINEILIKHILDSLSLSAHLPNGSILDVGSGAGLPEVPLSVVNTNKPFTLVDSSAKRVAFLKEVRRKLALTNITPVHSRVEDLTEQRFDIITCRAFSSITDLVQKTEHLLTEQGCWLAMKGVYPETEIDEIRAYYTMKTPVRLQVPGLDAERHLIQINRKQLANGVG